MSAQNANVKEDGNPVNAHAPALWYVAPGVGEIRESALPPLAPGMVEVETAYSLLSRGTERLVSEGRVPASEHARMRAPFQEGDFPFPVKYGYAAAGRVAAGPPELEGRMVFALAPHQARLRLPAAMVLALPEALPPARAVLAANMETALNATWDAAPPPGARVLVVGLGLVGLLIAGLLARRADLEVTGTDLAPERVALADHVSAHFVAPADVAADAFDLVFHTSASAAGLATGLTALRFEGTLVEVSWFGEEPVAVPLGGAFHSQRLTIRSSQVGHVAPSHRGRYSHRDRLALALDALCDPRWDALITEEVAFDALPAALGRLLGPGARGIATRIRY